MYRHLLVPLDHTDLSIEMVGNAVALARAVGARITFFHAISDPSGTLRGTVEAAVAPLDNPATSLPGAAAELLAKAEAAARSLGVPCASKSMVINQTTAAIIAAARASGCDLIFMAARGQRGIPGTAPACETLSAVINAGLPLLVSGVAAQGPSTRSIGIIRDEHRALAAVLHAWMHALATAGHAGGVADPLLMRAAVCYLDQFVLTRHDPKEEDHLFRRLRKRTSALNAELDELRRQHLRDPQRVADLARLVDILAAASGTAAVSATRELDDAVRSYASLVWDHLGREEGVILPAAQRHLTEADWLAVEAAFAKNQDPICDGETDAQVRQLFSRIVNAARH